MLSAEVVANAVETNSTQVVSSWILGEFLVLQVVVVVSKTGILI